jgi:hypothetical protein
MKSGESVLPDEMVLERRADSERRRNERRHKHIPVAVERRQGGTERRQGERRRQVDPTTCERDYTVDEIDFMRAMDHYKRVNRRPFPTWSEVLEVVRALGYRKVAEPVPLPGPNETPKQVREDSLD